MNNYKEILEKIWDYQIVIEDQYVDWNDLDFIFDEYMKIYTCNRYWNENLWFIEKNYGFDYSLHLDDIKDLEYKIDENKKYIEKWDNSENHYGYTKKDFIDEIKEYKSELKEYKSELKKNIKDYDVYAINIYEHGSFAFKWYKIDKKEIQNYIDDCDWLLFIDKKNIKNFDIDDFLDRFSDFYNWWIYNIYVEKLVKYKSDDWKTLDIYEYFDDFNNRYYHDYLTSKDIDQAKNEIKSELKNENLI